MEDANQSYMLGSVLVILIVFSVIILLKLVKLKDYNNKMNKEITNLQNQKKNLESKYKKLETENDRINKIAEETMRIEEDREIEENLQLNRALMNAKENNRLREVICEITKERLDDTKAFATELAYFESEICALKRKIQELNAAFSVLNAVELYETALLEQNNFCSKYNDLEAEHQEPPKCNEKQDENNQSLEQCQLLQRNIDLAIKEIIYLRRKNAGFREQVTD